MKLTIESLIKLVNVKEGTPIPYNLHDGINCLSKAFNGYKAFHHPELNGIEAFIKECETTDFEL